MRQRYGLAVIVALGLTSLVSAPASAQTAASAEPLEQVRVRLRALVTAQEAYYADHGTYTTDLAALRLLEPATRHSIWLRVIHAGGRSWTADAGHRALRGKSCVIYIGLLGDLPSIPQTADAALPPAREAEPLVR
jgi:type II secretory pathway pseudopilin PulG